MSKIAFELALNQTSFGQISTLILRELFDREKLDNGFHSFVIPIGPIDLSTQDKLTPEFNTWLNAKIQKSYENFTRDIPLFKLWHLNQSLIGTNHQTLLTFYELDRPTKTELNVASNQHKLLFTSKYTQEVFSNYGVESEYIPLAFDSYNFYKLDRKPFSDGRIVFNITAKAEKRKHTAKVIKSWIKKFGGNPKFSLQCAIYNNFLTPEQNNALCGQIVGGEKPFNVNFYPFFRTNKEYNQYLNSADIILDMSGGEGFSVPSFTSVALGKHAVVMNAHGFKGWATNENSVLVSPNGKESAEDGVFFHPNSLYNVGNIFTFDEDQFIDGCEKVIARFQSQPLNTEGIKLQKEFNKEKFFESIVKHTLS